MKIFIGADHAGYELKEALKTYLEELELGYEVLDEGALKFDADDDYPDFCMEVGKSVAGAKGSFGIVIGGSGQGEAIAANRVPGARAVVFYGQMLPKGAVDVKGGTSNDSFEIIKLARMHNDANVLSFAARFVTDDEAKFATELFLNTKFSGDERHMRRIKKLG
ncbi:MAG: RpiB/LacA/LacB family sugar-phosphate isomerase [bacterium]